MFSVHIDHLYSLIESTNPKEKKHLYRYRCTHDRGEEDDSNNLSGWMLLENHFP